MPALPLSPEQRQDAERLKAIYSAKKADLKLTQDSLAARCGWDSQGTVSQYLNGKIPLNLPAGAKFAKALECSIEEFSPRLAAEARTVSNLLPSSDTQRASTPADSHSQKHQQGATVTLAAVRSLRAAAEFITIHQYDAAGSMGNGLLLPDQPGVIRSWQVSRDWIEKNARAHTGVGNLCIVTGFGPSMQPMFNPGDPLLVDTGVSSVIADGIYFFRVGDEGFIKQLQKIPTPGGVKYIAKSKNPDYDSFEITADMDFQVLGRVIRVWCGTDF